MGGKAAARVQSGLALDHIPGVNHNLSGGTHMRLIHTCALAAIAAFGLSFTTATPADAKKKAKKSASCAMVAGEGTGITEALARTNAANSLNNVATRVGGKRAGKPKVTCTASLGGVVNTCQASQRVCK